VTALAIQPTDKGEIMSYAVKFTPVARPQDGSTGHPYAEARPAWEDLVTQLEDDIDAERDTAKRLVLRDALESALNRSWDTPGIVPVSFGGDERESFVYGVIRVGSFADLEPGVSTDEIAH
jgi:hypothetical protein